MSGASIRASFAILTFVTAARGAEAEPGGDLVSQLLALPAPPADWKAFVRELNRTLPPERHWGIDGPPGDEVPMEALLRYWLDPRPLWDSPRFEPSDRVRERLLEAWEEGRFPYHSYLLRWLKKTPEVFDRVRKIYDEHFAREAEGRRPSVRERETHDWLMRNSIHFRDELIRRVGAPVWQRAWPDREEDIETLANLDWPTAREILERQVAREEPELKAFALAFLHARAARAEDRVEEEKLRKRLVAMAADEKAPHQARNRAIEEVLSVEWPGRESWFVSLVGDRSVSLGVAVARDPERWMPVLRRLREHEDPAIREAAFDCMVMADDSVVQRQAGRDPLAEALREATQKAREELRRQAEMRSIGIRALLEEWPSDVSNEKILTVLAGRDVEVQSVLHAIDRREVLRAESAEDLRGLVKKGGAIAGVAAVVLGDGAVIDAILGGSDSDALAALLACSRLIRDALPLDRIAELLDSSDPRIARAAELYLESEDSPEARKLLQARHTGEIRILGSPAGSSRLEARLLKEMRRSDPPDEIHVLAYPGSDKPLEDLIMLRVRSDDAELLRFSSTGRYLSRRLSPQEWEGFRRFVEENRIEDLPAYPRPPFFFGSGYEYVHLTREGGRRVCIASRRPGSIYDCLMTNFWRLGGQGAMAVRHTVCDEIPGARLLFADSAAPLRSVWKEGEDLRVLCESKPDSESTWHSLPGDNLGAVVPPPAIFRPLAPDDAVHEVDLLCAYDWRARWDGQAILASSPYAGTAYLPGLWRYRRGETPIRIGDGLYANAIVTPDGTWLIVSQWEDKTSQVNLIDLRSGERRRVEIEGAEAVVPIAFLPAHGKVLLAFSREDPSRSALEAPPPPATWEHRLLDPATGAMTAVEGEFRPLHDQRDRPLQPTSRPDEAWAALPDPSDPSATAIGRYNTKAFAFRPILRVPYLQFDSMDLWVDEAERQAYLVANGDLLRIPLPAE